MILSDEMMDPLAPAMALGGLAGQPETLMPIGPGGMALGPGAPEMAMGMMGPAPLQATASPVGGVSITPQQPAAAPGRDWAGLGYGLAEILATANNEPQMAAMFRRRRELRDGSMNQQQLSGMQREYLLAREQGYQGSFLDFVRDRSVASQSRPAGAGGAGSGWKTQRLGNQLLRVNADTGETELLAEAPTGRRGGGGGRPRRAQIRNIGGVPHWVDPYNQTARPVEGFAASSAGGMQRAPQTTEGERAAAGFYNRMLQAENELLERETPDTFDMIASQYGDIGNYLTSPEGQVTLQKQVDWARAKLRSESGAVIGVDEARDEARNLFPRPGDSPETIEAKQRSRQAALEQMRLKSGRATYFIDQMREQNEPEDDFDPPIPRNVGADQVVVPDAGGMEAERSSLLQEMDAWRQANGL